MGPPNDLRQTLSSQSAPPREPCPCLGRRETPLCVGSEAEPEGPAPVDVAAVEVRQIDRKRLPIGIAPVAVGVAPVPPWRGLISCGRLIGRDRRGRLSSFRHDRRPRHAHRRFIWRGRRRRGRACGRSWRGSGVLGMAREGGGSNKKCCEGETQKTRLHHLNHPWLAAAVPSGQPRSETEGQLVAWSPKSACRKSGRPDDSQPVTSRQSWYPC